MNNLSIVGRGRGHKMSLLNGSEIWTTQSAFNDIGKANLVFRLHAHEKQLTDIQDTRIVCFEDMPIDGMRKSFGDLFHSSIAWMLGYAVFSGYRNIAFYGIDMAVEGEYGYQRDGLNRLIGKVESVGVNIEIPEWSAMFIPAGLYGLKENQNG